MRSAIKSRCPICEKEIEFIYQTEEIPFFSDILLISGSCPCGYRYTDTLILEENEPAEWKIMVEGAEDLSIRVIRSASGIMEIPELGVTVEPGPICEAFISNIEGVIDRVEQVLNSLLGWTEGEEREIVENRIREVEDVRAGVLPITLIIRDPTGNSTIISEKAEKRPLDAEDLDKD
ncbi:MAG TPA: ZPR1 zinc finger domain-containing protein [Methanomicrobiales archaeon]|nr:ZPR1 zinc finger domain-containing protein [Methanomicrobiales archaeon]